MRGRGCGSGSRWVCYRDRAPAAPRLPEGHGGRPARTPTAPRPHRLGSYHSPGPLGPPVSPLPPQGPVHPGIPLSRPGRPGGPSPCPGEGPGSGCGYWGSSRAHNRPRFSSRPTSVPRRPRRRSLTGSSRLTKNSGRRGAAPLSRRTQHAPVPKVAPVPLTGGKCESEKDPGVTHCACAPPGINRYLALRMHPVCNVPPRHTHAVGRLLRMRSAGTRRGGPAGQRVPREAAGCSRPLPISLPTRDRDRALAVSTDPRHGSAGPEIRDEGDEEAAPASRQGQQCAGAGRGGASGVPRGLLGGSRVAGRLRDRGGGRRLGEGRAGSRRGGPRGGPAPPPPPPGARACGSAGQRTAGRRGVAR